jgi:hypothetical protein
MTSRPTLLLLASLLGCEHPPAIDVAALRERSPEPIRTDSSAYLLHFDDPGWTTRIGFSYRAASDTVYIVNCNGAILMNLQKLEVGGWTDAWYAEGDQCLSPPIVVPPNTEFKGEAVIWGAEAVQRSYNTLRVPAIDGEYRLVWNQPVHHYDPGPGSFGDTLALANRVSNQFTLVRTRPDR